MADLFCPVLFAVIFLSFPYMSHPVWIFFGGALELYTIILCVFFCACVCVCAVSFFSRPYVYVLLQWLFGGLTQYYIRREFFPSTVLYFQNMVCQSESELFKTR